MYKCKHCGKEFETSSKLGGHIIRCKENPNRSGKSGFIEYNKLPREKKEKVIIKRIKHIEIRDDLFCQYCGKQCKNNISLKQHEIRCSNNPNKGTHHTKEFKDKVSETVRIKTAEYLQRCFPNGCRYNKNACAFIDKLNNQMGWNLQHAENGGEVKICGYFVDGYDKEKNIVFEYDERPHYIDVDNNILKHKDIKRQEIIIQKLKCDFFRYNEYTDTFYRVN